MFSVGEYEPPAEYGPGSNATLRFARGGFQGARGADHGDEWFAAGLFAAVVLLI